MRVDPAGRHNRNAPRVAPPGPHLSKTGRRLLKRKRAAGSTMWQLYQSGAIRPAGTRPQVEILTPDDPRAR